MGGQTPERIPLCLGMLAHVDAGKTTLCEQLLVRGGLLRKGCLLYTSPSPRDS